MPANDGAIVVFHCFGEVHGGDVHECLPGDEGGTASEDKGEGFAFQLSLRVGFFIQREGSYTVNDVLQMRGNREIPNRCGNQNAMGPFDLFLKSAEIIVGLAGFVVALHGEVLDVEISESDRFHGHVGDALAPFRKGRS